ncbi:MAG: folylpolyglutamate synthase/dihydrofolate synthase family protein [Sphingomicrobium sp.]
MKEVVRVDDPRLAALIARQATQYADDDQIGLDRINALLAALGGPHERLPPVFHVAGTNGKGSTCAFLRAGLEAAGDRVHVFTSPHLVRYNERIRLAGELISDAYLAKVMARVLDANESLGGSLFEVNTAAAFLAFADTPADAVVLEVGLGGRLDATNVVERPLVCGIASIGLDHQHFLGHTLAEIAAEKAGIARSNVPLVCLAQPAEALGAIKRVADDRGAQLLLENRDWTADLALHPALPGAHQVRNANLAWQMLSAQSALAVTDAQFRTGLAAATWPARLQRLTDGPLTHGIETWLDGAHNPDAAEALAAELAERGPMHLVLGILANKDAASIIECLAPHALSLSFVPIPEHESHDSGTLAERYNGRAAASLEDALSSLAPPRLIAGSLYLAGHALRLNGEWPN